MPDQCFFNDPADFDDFEEVEDELNYVFPVSFKIFLSYFNGGFISLFDPEKNIDFETASWNSNTILSLGEIKDAYDRIEYKFLGAETRFIPFLHTNTQEYLAFKWPWDDEKAAGIVYDIWHEAFPSEWESQIVYDGFEELLEDYINNNGIIQTIG